MVMHKLLLSTMLFSAASLSFSEDGSATETVTQVYFGDTHLHTSYSFDAFLNNNHSADPDYETKFPRSTRWYDKK